MGLSAEEYKQGMLERAARLEEIAADMMKLGEREVAFTIHCSADQIKCRLDGSPSMTSEATKARRDLRRKRITDLLRVEPRTFDELVTAMSSETVSHNVFHDIRATGWPQRCHGHAHRNMRGWEPSGIRNDLNYMRKQGQVIAVPLDGGARARLMFFLQK